jgi:hypothetical protein
MRRADCYALSMTGTSEEYRAVAADLRRAAEDRASSLVLRARLVILAEQFEQLAAEAGTTSNAGPTMEFVVSVAVTANRPKVSQETHC